MILNSRFFPFLLSYTIIVLGFFSFWIYADVKLEKNARDAKNLEVRAGDNQSEARAQAFHIQTPEAVKGIYITAATASISKFDKLMELIDKTELNTIVLDIKDWKQRPAFTMKQESLREFNISNPVIRDLEALIKKVHDRGIYLIARIAVFQDQHLTKQKPDWTLHSKRGGIWHDFKGVTWVDPTHPEVWKYNVELAREAYSRGFDEINFDYVRFPSDGPVEDIIYASYNKKTEKYLAMRQFFAYLDHELRRDGARQEVGVSIPISVDVFGLTMEREDGLGIGQRFIDVAPFFDAVSPMVYPSHYPPRYKNFANPAAHPYEIINDAMSWGVVKLKEMRASSTVINSSGKPLGKLRPWLQDFDLGADYDAAMIRKEIQAVYDAGLRDWLLWNAGNNYTENALIQD